MLPYVCIILTHTALGGGGIEEGRTVAGTCLKHAPLSLRNLQSEGSALQDGILTTHLRVCVVSMYLKHSSQQSNKGENSLFFLNSICSCERGALLQRADCQQGHSHTHVKLKVRKHNIQLSAALDVEMRPFEVSLHHQPKRCVSLVPAQRRTSGARLSLSL